MKYISLSEFGKKLEKLMIENFSTEELVIIALNLEIDIIPMLDKIKKSSQNDNKVEDAATAIYNSIKPNHKVTYLISTLFLKCITANFVDEKVKEKIINALKNSEKKYE